MKMTKELTQALNDNPKRELIFLYPEDGSDHYYTVGSIAKIVVDDFTTMDDTIWLRDIDEDELKDRIVDSISDRYWESFPLSDELLLKIEEEANKLFNEIEWKNGIIVYIQPS